MTFTTTLHRHGKPALQVVGGGVIGMSIALELHRRGIACGLVNLPRPGAASFAAAGMLAVHDAANPDALGEFARYSAERYAEFLDRVTALSGLDVPYQTMRTVLHESGDRTRSVREASIDPRMLMAALDTAVDRCGIVRQAAALEGVPTIHCTGAWAANAARVAVVPKKGQMLRVMLPRALRSLDIVHRSESVYVVPRTRGPQAGSALIGATIEDAGFDTETHTAALERLRASAADLLPELRDPSASPAVESWAGIRPATADGLPVLGAAADGSSWLALGHFRNGILLAPGTAQVIGDLVERKAPAIDIKRFAPDRLVPA